MANLATYCGKEFVVLQNECAKIVQTEFDFDSKTESLECSTANSNLQKNKSEFLPLLVKIIKVKAGSKMGIFSRQSTGVYNTMSQSKKNVFGVNERFIHKEFVIECFWKNIWTILEERSQNKIDQN